VTGIHNHTTLTFFSDTTKLLAFDSVRTGQFYLHRLWTIKKCGYLSSQPLQPTHLTWHDTQAGKSILANRSSFTYKRNPYVVHPCVRGSDQFQLFYCWILL